MDNRQIEQMLRESCSPKMPEGMRERVLSKSFNELPHRPSSRWSLIACRWKPILICAAVLFVIFANVSDTLVQDRLTRDIGRPAISAETYLAWQRALSDNSGLSAIDPYCDQLKGEDQL